MPVMTAALAMVDTTSAVATVDTARLAPRIVGDVCAMCILRVPQCLVGPRCRRRRVFATVASNSGQLFRRVNGHQTSVLAIFATLLPVRHGEA
jgi:hypothetical protein